MAWLFEKLTFALKVKSFRQIQWELSMSYNVYLDQTCHWTLWTQELTVKS